MGVRAKPKGNLVGFISGVPAHVKVEDKAVKMVEINFLCVHKKLRSKRLAPVLIKEITRRVNLVDIWQATYTAGVLLPKPIGTCRYTTFICPLSPVLCHLSCHPNPLITSIFKGTTIGALTSKSWLISGSAASLRG